MKRARLLTQNPSKLADEIVRAHADETAWLDEFAWALAQRRSGREFARFLAVWGLNRSTAAKLFGVSRQAVSKWSSKGIPIERSETFAYLSAATDLLVRYLKRDRIPAVVRRPAARLSGNSLLDLLRQGRGRDIMEACRAMFDFGRAVG